MREMRRAEDENLWQRVRDGDITAFEKIYKSYNLILKRYAGNFISDRYKIEEAVQNMFVELFEKRKKLLISKNLPAYLCVLLRRQILNCESKERRYVKLSLENEHNVCLCDSSSAESRVEMVENSSEKLRIMYNAIDNKLSRRQREIVLLKYFKNLSNSQIARKLGLEDGTVRNISFRAISCMRKQYSYINRLNSLRSYDNCKN